MMMRPSVANEIAVIKYITHTEKHFLNLVNSNRNQIVFNKTKNRFFCVCTEGSSVTENGKFKPVVAIAVN